MSTDIAEFLGAAIGLNLLFGVPLLPAGLITGVIAFAILGLQSRGFRRFELAITALLGIILLGFVYETLRIGPSAHDSLRGLIPGLARHELAVPRRGDHRRDRDAARDLPALGADRRAHARPQRRRAPPRAALRAPRRDRRPGPRRPRQHGDAGGRREAVPHARRCPASTSISGGPRPARSSRRRRRRAGLRRRPARLGRLVLERRHLRRAGRDGGLRQRPDPDPRAPRGHDAPRAGRAGDRRQPDERAGAQPGGAVVRNPLRADPAGDPDISPGRDGRARQRAVRRGCWRGAVPF